MSDKPLYEREIDHATSEQMREELDRYFARVQQHDPKNLKFALMVTGHDEEDGETHVRSLVGGPPQTIAHIIVELMDQLVERDPAFATFFLSGLSSLHQRKIAALDSTGGADVKARVKDLLDKLRSNTPPDGSVH